MYVYTCIHFCYNIDLYIQYTVTFWWQVKQLKRHEGAQFTLLFLHIIIYMHTQMHKCGREGEGDMKSNAMIMCDHESKEASFTLRRYTGSGKT